MLFDNHKIEKDFTDATILAGLKKKRGVNHLGVERVSCSADSLKRSGIPITPSLLSASSELWLLATALLLALYERWRNEVDMKKCTTKKKSKWTE